MARRARSKTPVSFSPADEVREIARTLIDDHHKHLQGQPLEFVFRSTAAKGRGGTSRHSQIIPKGPRDAYLSSDWSGQSRFYVLEFPSSLWYRWSEDQKAAEVDLCLARLIAGKDALQIVDLGLMDIARVIKRHGLYDDELKSFGKTIVSMQRTLGLDADDEPSAETEAPVDDSNLGYREDTTEILNGLHPLSVVDGGESPGDAAAQEQPADDALAGAAA